MPDRGEKPNRRIFRILRRGVREGGGRSPTDENALWAAHQRASVAVREAAEATQRIASHIAKQRGTGDALADRARAVSGRAHELGASFARVADVFARLELVALNAGLEGARLGEAGGHALGLVADEVRAQATRGSELTRELATAAGEIGSELAQIHAGLDRNRESTTEHAQEAARAGGATSNAERALGEIGERLKTTMGSDPETARAIAEAADHARALVSSLGALRGRVPQAIVVSVLKPLMDPLSRLLEGDEEE